MKRVLAHKYGWLVVALALGLPFALWLPLATRAHMVPEEPWHPVPAAYRRALFYSNLRPVDWSLIAREFETPAKESGYGFKIVYDLMADAPELENMDHNSAIREAIANEDVSGLHAASTRAVSQLTRYHLARAAEKIDQPGAAFDDVATAQRFFRAFREDFLEQADPEGFRMLGLAWLDLLNSVGNAGILNVGVVEPGSETFAAARKSVADYLISNYEVDDQYKYLATEYGPEFR